MRDPLRRDSILTILGLSLIVAFFLFVMYLPTHKATAQIQREIARAETAIGQVPERLAELKRLQSEIERRQHYLEAARQRIPPRDDVPAMLSEVARLAENSELRVTRLDPQKVEQRKTYREIPFRISFRGPFRGVVTFLKGLESRPRLFTVQRFSLRRSGEASDRSSHRFRVSENLRRGVRGRPQGVEADVFFSVYVHRANNANSAEIDANTN